MSVMKKLELQNWLIAANFRDTLWDFLIQEQF